MGQRAPAEERFFPRYLSVVQSFPGRLQQAGRDLHAQVLDVSRDGLGTLLPERLEKGACIDLVLGDKVIAFAVAHCSEDLIHKGKFRCGLRRSGTDNLVSLFRVAGYLEKE